MKPTELNQDDLNRLDQRGIDRLADDLAERVAVLEAPRRYVVGIVGIPGSGKSTLADRLRSAFQSKHAALGDAVVVPMDGFHFPNARLVELGLRGEKGSSRTFDAAGYADLLAKLRCGEVAAYPIYDRVLHEPVLRDEPAQQVGARVRLVITEGNYLLLPDGAWPRARASLDQAWALATDPDAARAWILARHVRGGKSPTEAEAHYRRVDQINSRAILEHLLKADRTLRWPG